MHKSVYLKACCMYSTHSFRQSELTAEQENMRLETEKSSFQYSSKTSPRTLYSGNHMESDTASSTSLNDILAKMAVSWFCRNHFRWLH